MPYSLDLRQKVVNYLENGGSITEAAKVFGIGRASIYRWLNRPKLEAIKVKRRQRKLDWTALEKDVKENPDARLVERAQKFGVHPSAICYAFKKLKITRKKKQFRYKERNHEERINYFRTLRKLIKIYGSKNLVFIDESGFEEIQECVYGWARQGKKVYGEKPGKRRKRESLCFGQKKKRKRFNCPHVV